MSELKDMTTIATEKGKETPDAQLAEIYALSDEIVDLFYTQLFAHSAILTPSDVCKAFSDIMMRHWKLCCMMIYLCGDDGRLCDEDGRIHEVALNTDEYVDEATGREVGEVMAAAIESEGRELQVWLDEKNVNASESEERCRKVLAEAGLRAGVTVPIYAHNALVGALVVVTPFPERLRAALKGIRFIAAPVAIAVGNARRAASMREQRHRIEHLVEELQQRSQALEEANRELRRVAHYRSLFLARMSHELRTPLTSILGFTEILIDHENLTDAQRRFVGKIQSSGMQLQTSLNQLVDLSRLESGQSELFLHEFSLREALRESCAAVARLAQKQNVRVECCSVQELPSIVSDEGKLRQVLYNFLAYAISRSPEGERISVSAELIAPCRFEIRIEDRGEPLSDTSHIFEPMDISAPTEKATSMNELGLAIARRLIDVLGGQVELESSAPHGLKVSIRLPARPTEG
ncbi:MAG TPA: GAF domain-containing sensor histidine kinase [Pyrinomonadaceae bacterium]|jgi:signal transduction histidine kinase